MTDAQSSVPSLKALGRVLLEDAKNVRARGQTLQTSVLMIGVFAVIVQAVPPFFGKAEELSWLGPTSKFIAYVCALLSLSFQVWRWWLQRVGADKHSLGSTIKRRALLIESLGPSSEQLDIRLLRELAGADAEREARVYPMPESYYASTLVPGLERLRENLQESAFFSRALYGMAARSAFIKFGIAAVCVVVGLLAVVLLVPREIGPVLANCVLSFIAFLVSTDRLGQAMNFLSAATAVERIERRLANIAPNGVEAYFAAFADYEAATAMAPSVPTALYQKERQRLDALWRNKTGQ
ncbi:MAG: hypothetical protein JNG88_08390 [Phycisphaerales bacterium]|nr:hypothetical protein [Phycisphaerales bacterium]